MKKLALLLLLGVIGISIPHSILAQNSDYGYVRIAADRDNIPIYVDGGLLGNLPIDKFVKLPTGSHLVSFFDGATTSRVYQTQSTAETERLVTETAYLLSGGIPLSIDARARKAWADYDAAIIEAGSKQLFIQPEDTSYVELRMAVVDSLWSEKQKAQDTYKTCMITGSIAAILVCIISLIAINSL